MFKHLLYLFYLNSIFFCNAYANELNINSEKLEIDRNNNISIFTGNVHAYNEDINIWSESLIVKFYNDGNEIEVINAENKVKIINEGITAIGEIGIYNPNTDTLNMYGNVEVIENNNYVKCDELFLDIKNSISIMKSNSSKRVKAFIENN